MQDLSCWTRDQTLVPCNKNAVLTTGPPGKFQTSFLKEWFVWKAEDIFLVNNRDCAKIVYMNQAEEVVKTTDLTEQGLPYIFRLSMPTNPGICMFVDANGEEIR